MPGTDRVALAINRAVPIKRTARVMQVEGIFDIPPSAQSKEQWSVVLPLDERRAVEGEPHFEIVVTCDDEAQQRELLEQFNADGLKCRALIG